MGNQCSGEVPLSDSLVGTPLKPHEPNNHSASSAPRRTLNLLSRNPLESSQQEHRLAHDVLPTSDGADDKAGSSGCASTALTTSLRSDEDIQAEMPADAVVQVERETSKDREMSAREDSSTQEGALLQKKRRSKLPPPIVTTVAPLSAMDDAAMFVAVKEATSRHCESVRLELVHTSHDDSTDDGRGQQNHTDDDAYDMRVSFASHAIVVEGSLSPQRGVSHNARSQLAKPSSHIPEMSPRQGALHNRMGFNDSSSDSDDDTNRPKDEDCETTRVDEANLFMSVAHYPRGGGGSSTSYFHTRGSNGDSSHSFSASTSSGGVFVKIFEGPSGPGQYRHQLAKPKPTDRRSKRRAPSFGGVNI